MSNTQPISDAVAKALAVYSIDYEAIPCDPALADTRDFCNHYGYQPEESANALLVGVRKLSFADPELTRELTGMELGGVTPFGLPDHLPLWADSRIMDCNQIILGGGNRSSKIIMPPAEFLKIPNAEIVDNLAKTVTAPP